MEECRNYENTAKCVLGAKVKRLIVTNEHNAWELSGGLDDNYVVGINFKDENDITTFLQYYCLNHSYLVKDEYEDNLKKISDQCYDVINNDDILPVGHNCDEDCYIINSRNNIVNNLLNIDKNES